MDQIADIQDWTAEYIERFIEYLPTLVGAILFLIVGWWVIKFILGSLKRLFTKRHYDLALQNFILTILEWGLKILLIITVIGQLGITTTSFVAMIGAAGLAIGLALQGSLANFAGGVLIILLKPFRIGDWIEVNGISGSVKEISLFYTKLDTFGNQLAIIPNGELSNDNIVNYSGNPTRRDAITIGVSYESDIKKAKQVLLNLLHEQEGILKDPAPAVVVTELADSSVNFSVRFWAPNEVFWDCHWYTIEEAKTRLEAAGISIPFPQRDVHFFDHSKKESTPSVENNKD
ncbi:mechanosensitive ion channel protein MscS [Salinimicrobium marinum]|uniref:Mechanosensitive ion channel protein MscS n=1 Tax=Salinimicrobium marinum TaxID=680283 RepID=A0A918S541_9FLAO|nr:mechanosensitive ion channel domain-containing protein [Salinimicrobium marinum]GHA24455.1 mechanosensitive ion channel protein MscS [Salinimicrobium marinum]